jgi:ABC-type dipeptide/oligopeptide/nickel transport system permease subunit
MSVAEAEVHEIQLEAPSGLWSEAWRRLVRNPGAIVGFVFIGALIFAALFAPVITSYNPVEPATKGGVYAAEGPSSEHWFGVDRLGRDQFTRIMYGARYTLMIAVVAVGIGLALGLLIGAVAGFFGGFLDSLLMRCVDVMLAIPGLLLAIGIAALLGPGLTQVMIAVGVAQIPIFARLLRGSILAQRDNDFVLAARAVGVRRRALLLSHILPNAISPVIVQATLLMATAIIDVAGLGFLGLGPQDPATPEWGTMLTDANEFLQVYPWLAIIPGLAIIVSVLGFNLIGDGLREALDPKFRGRA